MTPWRFALAAAGMLAGVWLRERWRDRRVVTWEGTD